LCVDEGCQPEELLTTGHMCLQETVEPLMEQYKPPGLIKKIYFKNLSFGDAPFKIENAWVEDEGEKHVLLEASPASWLHCILISHLLPCMYVLDVHSVHELISGSTHSAGRATSCCIHGVTCCAGLLLYCCCCCPSPAVRISSDATNTIVSRVCCSPTHMSLVHLLGHILMVCHGL